MLLTKHQFLFLLSIFSLLNHAQCDYNDYFMEEFQTKITTDILQKLSPKCASFYNISNFNNKDFQTIFVTLIDSSTKIISGFIGGNLNDIGIFDECYRLKAPLGDETIHGKYCLGDIEINIEVPQQMMMGPTPQVSRLRQQLKSDNGTQYYTLYMHFAYCTPSFCTAEDLQEVVQALMPLNITFSEDTCQSKDTQPDLSTGAISTITVISLFAFIVVVSTLYEVSLYYCDKNPPHDILLAFSALKNGRQIFKSTTNPEQLLCLNGIKAISMMWVVLGHEYTFDLTGVLNYGDTGNFTTDKANMWVLNAPLSVDTFFMVGGLVTMYTFLKSCDKGVKFNIILYYIHRYLRLTPVLVIITLIHLFLLNYLGTGPFWNGVQTALVAPCEDRWWAGLLYIQNYFRPQENCIPQSWYLSVDMQLFVLSPLVLLPAKFWPKILYPALCTLIVAGIVSPFVISYHFELPGLMVVPDQVAMGRFMIEYYMQTYARFGPYVIGMLFGVIAYKIRKNTYVIRKNKENMLISLVIWIVAVTGLVASLYGGADMLTDKYNRVGASFFNALDRNAWALCVGLVVILCISGFGGPVNAFLSFPIFQILTKLSYTTYLVHYMVLSVRTSSVKTLGYFSHFQVMHSFWGDFMLTLVLSFLFCVTFESPVITLEKYLLGGASKSVKKPEVEVKKNENGTV